MKILIIEDEKPAADKLESFVKYYDPDIKVLGSLRSVESSVNWFKANETHPDLIFMDIQLQDGNSFEIFKQVPVSAPIIFITAYNQYAIDAFKVNSIDYLLKPLDYDHFYKSLEKFKNFKESILGSKERVKYEELNDLLSNLQKNYKTRFMIKVGDHIKSITTNKIASFFAEGRNVSILTEKGRQFVIDYKLEELEEMLDPAVFYRINRSFIVNIDAISDVVIYSSSRLKVKLEQEFDKELIVSREKVADFKYWFNGEDK